MGIVNITRGSAAPKVSREDVKPGQVFSLRRKDGKMGMNYAHIGMNGRLYSINVRTGELASSRNSGKEVVLTGTFKYTLSKVAAPGVVRECRRSEVKSGEYFTPMIDGEASGKVYLHLGRVQLAREGFLSVPLDNTENHAIGKNANGRVSVLGTFVLDTTLSE